MCGGDFIITKSLHRSFAVWALTTEGYIYRRAGISSENYIGDYWAQVPGSLSLITGDIYSLILFFVVLVFHYAFSLRYNVNLIFITFQLQ